MAVSQLPQAPYRQDRKIFPTPIVGDILFSEVKDCNRSDFPAYGTPHPNTKKWPDHKLVYIKPVDIERNEIFEFFYAAERENQDLYNFSFGVRSISNREFRVVNRTYVTLRESFTPVDIEFGTPMPDIPEGKFDGVSYVFYDKQQQQTEEKELNSLFVIEVHSYVEDAILSEKLLYSKEKPNLIPEKFRALVPTTTVDIIVEGKTEEPTLLSNQYSVSEDQINSSVKRVRTTSQDDIILPVELPASQVIVDQFGGIVADRNESLVEDGTPVDSGFGILESSVVTLGNGKSVKTTVSAPTDELGNPLYPSLEGVQIDPRYGVPFVSKRQIIDATTAPQGGIYYGDNGSIGSIEIEPRDQWRSLQNITYLPSLPAPQVWYGLRRENLPDVLVSVAIVGTERYVAVPTWARIPDGPMKARFTRFFSYGPPADFDSGFTRVYYAAEPFQASIEYDATSITTSSSNGTSASQNTSSSSSTSSSIGTSTNASSGTSTSVNQGTSNSSSDGTSSGSSHSTSSSTSTSTSTSTSSGTSTSQSSGISSSTSASSSLSTSQSQSTSTSQSESTSIGTSTSSGTSTSQNTGTSLSTSQSQSTGTGQSTGTSQSRGTSTSTNTGTSTSISTGTSSGTNTSSGTSTSQNSGSAQGSSNSNSQGNSSTTNGGGIQKVTISSRVGGGVVRTIDPKVSQDTHTIQDYRWNEGSNNGASSSSSTSSQSSSSSSSQSSSSSSSQSSSSSGSQSSSSSGSQSSSSSSSQSGSSSSSQSSSSASTQSGTSSGSQLGSSTSSQTGSSSSSQTSVSSGTQNNESFSNQSSHSNSNQTGYSSSSNSGSSSSTSTSNGTSVNSSESSSNSSSQSSSSSSSVSESTGKTIFTLSVPKCLRNEIKVDLPNGDSITIPATTPTELNGWIEVSRQSEHWRNSVWVTETIEVHV